MPHRKEYFITADPGESDFPFQDFSQNVTMALRFILSAMAHQGNWAPLAQFLEKAQRKLLPVIFDRAVFLVKSAALKQFFAVTTAEFAPLDSARQKIF